MNDTKSPGSDYMLCLSFSCPITSLNGGLFVSTGQGGHSVRTIDSYELIFVCNGTLYLFEEHEHFALRAGQTLILRPGVEHGGLRPYEEDLTYFWVHFRLSRRGARRRMADLSDIPQTVTIRDPERFTELFRLYLSYQEAPVSDLDAQSYLIMLMLSEVSQSKGPAEHPSSTEAVLVHHIDACIARHFNEAISTSVVAAELNYNPDYIERVYHRSAGVSITDAIHRRRIKEARAQLLMNDEKNIDQIGFDCGYANPRYFRRMFKRLTHITPKEYRQLYARLHINTH